MKTKCWYGGMAITEMEFANFTRQEIRDYERARHVDQSPVKCNGCHAVRKLQWVKKNLGGRGSGNWQWSLIFPHHNKVDRQATNPSEK